MKNEMLLPYFAGNDHQRVLPVGWLLFSLLSLLLLFSIHYANNTDTVLAWLVGIVYVSYDTCLLAYVAWKTRYILALPAEQSNAENAATSAPSIAVLIPARNEAASIVSTVNSVLEQTSVPEQIWLIDDGSTDETAVVLEQHFCFRPDATGRLRSTYFPPLFLLAKHNSGKADSLNRALEQISADVVVTVDADTHLDKQAIAAIRQAFANETTLVAACGLLQPQCRGDWRAKAFGWFQHFEYLRAFLARAAWMQGNALLLVSGAFAAYRRSALSAVGGYNRNSLVEDYELIHRMHRYAHDRRLLWTIRVLHEATATTDAPNHLSAFLQQRKRWFAGFLRTQFMYRDMIGSARYGAVGRLMLPIKTADTLQPIFGLTAFYFLCRFLFSDVQLAIYALIVIAIKLLIDFSYHMWAVHLYHRWTRQPVTAGIWWRATLCTLAEPFSFQLARHVGALLGWCYLLSNRATWIPVRRSPN